MSWVNFVSYLPMQSKMYDEAHLAESHPRPGRYTMIIKFAGIGDDFPSFGCYGHDLKGLHACGLNSAAVAVYVACSEAGQVTVKKAKADAESACRKSGPQAHNQAGQEQSTIASRFAQKLQHVYDKHRHHINIMRMC